MSKAILILDMPKSCEECSLCYNGIDCAINGWVVCSDEGQTNRSSRCPLKPMPQKKEVKEIKHFEDIVNIKTHYDLIEEKIVGQIKYDTETIFNEGYNSCLDEILGDKK